MATATKVPARTARRVAPPGPAPLPLFGNVPQFQRDPLSFLAGVQRSYGDIASLQLGRFPVVLVSRPEYARAVLIERARNFTSREFNWTLRDLLGDGLLTLDGDEHRRQRRIVQPAFHKKRVESYAEIMTTHTRDLLATWRPWQRVDIAREMQRLTLRIVAKALFDVDLQRESGELGQAFTDVIENPTDTPLAAARIPVNLPFTPYGRRVAGLTRLDTFVYDLIARRRAEGRDTGDVLSMLLAPEAGGSALSDQQARDEAMTLFAAGHETTANALTWTFYLLAQHPDALLRLLREVEETLGGRAPGVEDLPRMPYLDAVVTESMRAYPPVWTIGRRAIEAFDLGGYHFPAGQIVMISQWVLHHLPEVWGDPWEFRPERWQGDGAQRIPQGAYIPFGAGPRMCIGMPFAQMEARLLLATILQRFTPRLAPDAHVETLCRVTLRPKHGLPVILEPSATATGSSGSGARDERSA